MQPMLRDTITNQKSDSMKDYTYNIKIPALIAKEAEDKIKALATLATHLTAAELTKIAYILKNDAVKTSIAKQYLGI